MTQKSIRILSCLSITALVLCSVAAHAQRGPNVVYVESNIGKVANQNSVFAWTNDGQGNLTPIAGAPFLTGGTGFYSSIPAVANAIHRSSPTRRARCCWLSTDIPITSQCSESTPTDR